MAASPYLLNSPQAEQKVAFCATKLLFLCPDNLLIMGCIPSHPQESYQQRSQPYYHKQQYYHHSVAPQMQPARSPYSAAIEARLLNRIPCPNPEHEANFWRNMEATKDSSYSQGLILMGDESQAAGKTRTWAEIRGRQTQYRGSMGSGGECGGHGGNGGGSTSVGYGNNGGGGGNGNDNAAASTQDSPPYIPRSPALGSWSIFYTPRYTPTPAFEKLIRELMSYLDPLNTGHVVPEAYSAFQTLMSCPSSENTWLSGSTTNPLQPCPQSNADRQLQGAFDALRIDYRLIPRPTTTLTQQAEALRTRQPLAPGVPPMPCLTLAGLIEEISIGAFAQPDIYFLRLNIAISSYRTPSFQNLGSFPRWCLPEEQAATPIINRIEMAKTRVVDRATQEAKDSSQMARMYEDAKRQTNISQNEWISRNLG